MFACRPAARRIGAAAPKPADFSMRVIRNFSVRSMLRNSMASAPDTRVEAKPQAPARPVRPTR